MERGLNQGETTGKASRHWQSANALLKICWQLEGDGSPMTKNCQVARHSKQSKLNTYKFMDIEKNKNFRVSVSQAKYESTMISVGFHR